MELTASWLIYMKTRLYQYPTRFDDEHMTDYDGTSYKTLRHDSVKNQSVGLPGRRFPFIGRLSASKDDQRLKHAKKALVNGLIKPSKYGLQKWSRRDGNILSDSAITDFQKEWLKEGLIETYKTKNGKMSYRLIG